QPLGLVCEVEGQHQNVRDALVALALEMVLGEPERVVPAAVEQARQIARLGIGGDEALVRKYAAVHGGAAVADVVHVQVAGVQAVELGDHGPPSTPPYHIRAGPVASVSARSATPSAHAAGPTWEGWGKASRDGLIRWGPRHGPPYPPAATRTASGRSRRPSRGSPGRSGAGGRRNRRSAACWSDGRGRAMPGRNPRSRRSRRSCAATR